MKGNKAKGRRATSLKRYALLLGVSILLFLVYGPRSYLYAKDEISVSREKDKTVYSIDSNDESRLQQEKERDKAWDMLRNMPVIINKRQGQPKPVQPAQPAASQPVQPAPAK